MVLINFALFCFTLLYIVMILVIGACFSYFGIFNRGCWLLVCHCLCFCNFGFIDVFYCLNFDLLAALVLFLVDWFVACVYWFVCNLCVVCTWFCWLLYFVLFWLWLLFLLLLFGCFRWLLWFVNFLWLFWCLVAYVCGVFWFDWIYLLRVIVCELRWVW